MYLTESQKKSFMKEARRSNWSRRIIPYIAILFVVAAIRLLCVHHDRIAAGVFFFSLMFLSALSVLGVRPNFMDEDKFQRLFDDLHKQGY